jgi:Carboxypeptidase regulatory-like domain/TonB dependent receptor
MKVGMIARSVALLLVILITFTASHAQTPNATVTGQVTDQSGKLVPGAAVVFTNINTGVSYATQTNGEGIYSLPTLEPGIYRANVTKEGFKSIVKPDIELHVQDQVSINFSLELGSVSETITVQAGGINMNTTDATVGMVVDRDFVENLPLNGRSFQQLITLAPGVNLTGESASAGGHSLGEFSVDGQRPTSNYFTVDGVSANLGYGEVGFTSGGAETLNAAGTTTSLVSVDALQEFKILTNSFAPEFGRTPGGQVILLTRSGTNEFHGTAFEYFRNDVLNANDWFANRAGLPRSPLRFNDFGGTLGGPIFKNKTFFFLSYEGQRLIQPQFAVVPVPDAASRQAAPAATQAILNAFPIANGAELGDGQAQFSGGYSNPISTDSLSLRVDHNFSSALQGFFRYSYAPSSGVTRQLDPANSDSFSYRTQTYTGGLTYVITPHLVNEARVNFSQNRVVNSYSIDDLGGASPPPASALFVAPLVPQNASVLMYVGSLFFEQGLDHTTTQRQINLVDGLSWTVGTHQLKFGVDYLRSLPILSALVGDYYSFNGVSDVANNSVDFFDAFAAAPIRADSTNFSLYAQDGWRASSRLTLTYGLRWDLNPPPRDRYPNNGNYLPLVGNYATGDVSVGELGSSLWSTKHLNFAPRAGAAYQFRRSPSFGTVIRAGAGLFYDVATESAVFGPFGEFPNYLFSNTISAAPLPITPAQAVIPAPSLTNPAPGSEFQTYPRDFAAPRSWQWNVSVQQALGEAQTITASYVANLGRNLLYSQLFSNVGSNGYYVFYADNSSTSDYQALQLQFRRVLSHGLAAALNYAWAHSLDDSSENSAVYQPPDTSLSARSNWGPSDFDIRQNFTGALSWDVPGKSTGWLGALTGGWGLDAITTARTALPVDVVEYVNTPQGGYHLRPDVVPGAPLYLYGPQYAGGRAINPTAFVTVPNGQGDLGRNALRGFGLVETDLSVRRTFHITERMRLLLRGDFFNIFNHPNFANPISNLSSTEFGLSTSMANSFVGSSGSYPFSLNSVFQTGGPRSVQLSLKLLF